MQIQMMKLSEIHPYEKNPRFNDGAVEAVANAPPHKIQAKIYSERYLLTMDGTVYTMGIKGGLHIHRQKLRPNEHGYLRATINGRNEYVHRIVVKDERERLCLARALPKTRSRAPPTRNDAEDGSAQGRRGKTRWRGVSRQLFA